MASAQEISIAQLANELIQQIAPQAKIVCDEIRKRPKNSEVNRLLGDNSKLMLLTDWRQQYSFRDGIAETIEWMRQNLDKYKCGLYNI